MRAREGWGIGAHYQVLARYEGHHVSGLRACVGVELLIVSKIPSRQRAVCLRALLLLGIQRGPGASLLVLRRAVRQPTRRRQS